MGRRKVSGPAGLARCFNRRKVAAVRVCNPQNWMSREAADLVENTVDDILDISIGTECLDKPSVSASVWVEG